MDDTIRAMNDATVRKDAMSDQVWAGMDEYLPLIEAAANTGVADPVLVMMVFSLVTGELYSRQADRIRMEMEELGNEKD